MKIKKGGSIWKLATVFGNIPLSANFCAVFWTCLATLLATTLIALLGGYFLGDFLASFYVFLTTGEVYGVTGVVIFFSIVATIIIIGAHLLSFISSKSGEVYEKIKLSEDNFISTAYRSWKDKYCPTVEEVS